jgi:hypothetical protein
MDIAHNWGKTRVATASLSTLKPIASCTESVAIWKDVIERTETRVEQQRTITAGSFVRIFESIGTSFCVKVSYEKKFSLSSLKVSSIPISNNHLIEGLDHGQESFKCRNLDTEETRLAKDRLHGT